MVSSDERLMDGEALSLPAPAGVRHKGWHRVSTLCQALIKRWETAVQHRLSHIGLYAEAQSANTVTMLRKIRFSQWRHRRGEKKKFWFLFLIRRSPSGQRQCQYIWNAIWDFFLRYDLSTFVSRLVVKGTNPWPLVLVHCVNCNRRRETYKFNWEADAGASPSVTTTMGLQKRIEEKDQTVSSDVVQT